jgi:three-Cys-motif partner protein
MGCQIETRCGLWYNCGTEKDRFPLERLVLRESYATSGRNTVDDYLLPQDDGLPARTFGPWVVEKLDYLTRYINIFETSMHNKPWRKRFYIDLFAGSGKCRSSEQGPIHLGSPLISLKTTYPFTDYVFVDSDPSNIETLKRRCDTSPLRERIQYQVGDGNVLVKEIIEQIQCEDQKFLRGQWSSLNLAFLDPAGLELQWRTVATLATPGRIDLIVHYSQMGLNRNMLHFLRISGRYLSGSFLWRSGLAKDT